MKAKRLKYIPKFMNEAQERHFWQTHSITDYMHQLEPVKMDFSMLKPSTRPVTVRLPESLLASLKTLANKKDVPYQSLMKVFLSDRIRREFSFSTR
ncbi:MAG: BrnA antitoxin family protein [bacterium]